MKQTGFSQKVIIFNEEGKFLTMYRTETAPSRPNTWDLPGGDLDFGEDAFEGAVREAKEETGLDISELEVFDVESHINKDGDFWITIAFKAKAASQDVTLSFEHSDFKWLTPEEFLKLESADKLRRFVKKLCPVGEF